jgi:hypothetical protein
MKGDPQMSQMSADKEWGQVESESAGGYFNVSP